MVLFSTLYPSAARPGHGLFVETRLRELLRGGEVDARVVAPVPWFFSSDARFGARAAMARTPAREHRGGTDVLHPRYALLPKVGTTLAPLGLALGALPALRRLTAEGFDFDLIDAHYFYPDGVAAALLGRWLGKPFVVTARGSDLNLIGAKAVPRRMMQWAARRAATSIGVSRALVEILRGWGLPDERLEVIRNGVDLERFRPMSRAAARDALGIDGGPVVLSVGNLVELKGHDLTLDAFAALVEEFPAARLFLIGTGPEQARLKAQVRRLGLEASVRLVGNVPNAELFRWYNAADVSVLSSSREGWANVLLESMACATPVVGTDRGGTPEVISKPAAGRLVAVRDAAHIAAAIRAVLHEPPAREATRAHAARFGWEATSRAQVAVFQRALGRASMEELSCATSSSSA